MAWSRGDTLTGPAGRGGALAPYYTMAATFLSGADNSTSEGGGMEGWIHLPSRSSWTCQRLCWRPPRRRSLVLARTVQIRFVGDSSIC